MCAPGLAYALQMLLQLRRLERCLTRLVCDDVIAAAPIDGGQRRRANAGCAPRGPEQSRGRGLSVGSRDASNAEIAARVLLECRRERREGHVSVLCDEPRHVRRLLRRLLGDDGDGAAAQRIRGKRVSVVMEPAHGHEQAAGGARARVVIDARDVRIGAVSRIGDAGVSQKDGEPWQGGGSGGCREELAPQPSALSVLEHPCRALRPSPLLGQTGPGLGRQLEDRGHDVAVRAGDERL